MSDLISVANIPLNIPLNITCLQSMISKIVKSLRKCVKLGSFYMKENEKAV